MKNFKSKNNCNSLPLKKQHKGNYTSKSMSTIDSSVTENISYSHIHLKNAPDAEMADTLEINLDK